MASPVYVACDIQLSPVLEWLAGGMTIDEILADYPDLERDDILATLAYAARLAHVNRAEPLTA